MAAAAMQGRFRRLPGWGKRRLPLFRTITTRTGRQVRLQLHATRGWVVC